MQGEFREEYLEAIFDLSEEGGSAKTSDIAKRLKVKSSSVSDMLRKLSAEGLVAHQPYRGVDLTAKGLSAATKLKRKHRLLERFLYDVLKYGKDKVHDEACRMEHALSDKAADALDRLLKHPKKCPDDGKIIPRKGEVLRKISSLLEIPYGRKFVVFKIGGTSTVRRSLREIGIREGGVLELIAKQPASGPVVVKTGNMTLTIGRGMASKVCVRA